jgi:hypothetical protein
MNLALVSHHRQQEEASPVIRLRLTPRLELRVGAVQRGAHLEVEVRLWKRSGVEQTYQGTRVRLHLAPRAALGLSAGLTQVARWVLGQGNSR